MTKEQRNKIHEKLLQEHLDMPDDYHVPHEQFLEELIMEERKELHTFKGMIHAIKLTVETVGEYIDKRISE